MRIGIVGGGWYGCHLGLVLREAGCQVDVWEAGDAPLQGASTNNQARLHVGYHYPRCYTTRMQTAACFQRFIDTYPTLSLPIENNIYAVSSTNSVMDFQTYCQIMAASGAQFRQVDPVDFGLRGVDGAIATEERWLDLAEARRFFTKALGQSLRLNARVSDVKNTPNGAMIEGVPYDYVINCTWCALDSDLIPRDMFFEPTILLYYDPVEPFYGALTTMDGRCFSVYPYDHDYYTLSHVQCTARGSYSSFAAAKDANDRLTQDELFAIRANMVAEVEKEFPSFSDRFRYRDVQLSIKTKYVNNRASRDTLVFRDENLFLVFSGKIDTIFVAEDAILKQLGLRADVNEEIPQIHCRQRVA